MSDVIEMEVSLPETVEFELADVIIKPDPSLQEKSITVTANGTQTITATEGQGYDGLSKVNLTTNVPNPSTGKVEITSLAEVDVTNYATAQVVDSDLVASNIKKDVDVLGVVGSYEIPKIKIMTGENLFNYSTESTLPTEALDTSSVTSMAGMFWHCEALTSLDVSGFDTSNVTKMVQMFAACKIIETLDLSNFDTSNVTNLNQMFYNCLLLENFSAPTFYISVGFATCTHLTHDSLMSIINKLATVSTTQTLNLGSVNLAKLSAEEIAIATVKGWTVA